MQREIARTKSKAEGLVLSIITTLCTTFCAVYRTSTVNIFLPRIHRYDAMCGCFATLMKEMAEGRGKRVTNELELGWPSTRSWLLYTPR
jgi:hypothetical protein